MKTQEKNKKTNLKKFKICWDGVPATARQTLFEASLYESVFASLFWHIISALLIWIFAFLFLFFGIVPKLFPTPKSKINDIEFTINNKSIHKIHHHKIVEKQSTMDTDKASNAESKKLNSDISSASIKHKSVSQPQSTTTNKNNLKSKTGSHSKSNIPDLSMPNLKSMSSGLGASSRNPHHAVGFNSSSVVGFNNSSMSENGSSGHSGFDKNATRKIITTYDISPYVNELKRNIRWNWKVPKGNESKRVELFLRIAKDGRLIILNVKKTSEIGDVDNAALNAVKKCLPLNPLPGKYNKSYLDIIFTFGSNSVGSRY